MGRLATPPNIFQKADILGWPPSQRRCLETGSFSTTTDAFRLSPAAIDHTLKSLAYRALISSPCANTAAGSDLSNFSADSGGRLGFSLICAWNERCA